MKSLAIYIILFCIPSYSHGQTKYNYVQGYKSIKKAERNVKYNNYKKASRMIAKAKNSNYGFCGNACLSFPI